MMIATNEACDAVVGMHRGGIDCRKTRASDDFGTILAINGPFPEECHRSIDERRSLDLSCNSDNFSYFEFADASVQRLKVL